MIEDDERPETPGSVPDPKPRFTPLVIVSMLLGFLLCLAGVGAYFSYQQSRGLVAEIVKAREEIKKKDDALEGMKAQIEALSRQISTLKEFSVARSGGNGTGKSGAPQDPALPSAASAVPASMPSSPANAKEPAKDNAGSPAKADAASVLAKEKRAKPDAQNCDLVGKSPEEQAATLKRCVGAMDEVAGKSRTGSATEKRR